MPLLRIHALLSMTAAATLLAACNGSDGPATGPQPAAALAQTELFSDNAAAPLPTSQGESGQSGATLADSLFATGIDESEMLNSWFCTTLADGAFEDRAQWLLWESGRGQIDGEYVTWSHLDDVLRIQRFDSEDVYVDVAFGERSHENDRFSARIDEQRRIECDWSGPPRITGLQNDEEITEPTTEEITGEGIEELLLTGKSLDDADSWWQCFFTVAGFVNRESTISFLEDGTTWVDGIEGRWTTLSSDSVLLTTGQAITIWEDVFIPYRPADAFDRFTARDDNDVEVSCNWGGVPRTGL